MKINSQKRGYIIFCLLIFTTLFYSCKSDDETPPDCGCDSETRKTIPQSANLVGRLAFKSDESIDPYYTNQYWITYIEQNCTNCVHHMIICNEDILGNQFNDIINLPQGEFVEVKFSGNLKEVCQKRFDLSDVTYERITLTSIERQ